jgi:hypothetical protein
MKTYKITLLVDQAWFHAISEVTDVAYVEEGEVCEWLSVEEQE